MARSVRKLLKKQGIESGVKVVFSTEEYREQEMKDGGCKGNCICPNKDDQKFSCEHRRVIRRMHVQPNHVRGLGLKVWIVRLHVALEPMRLQPSARAVARAAAMIARAERPVMVIGSQACEYAAESGALADALRALDIPVFLAGMARGLLGANSARQVRHHRKSALREADVVLLCGVPMDFRLDYGRHIGGGTAIVSVNRDRGELHKNRRSSLAICGDADLFVRALASAGARAACPTWAAHLAERDAQRDAEIAAESLVPLPPINPLALCRAVDDLLTDRSTVVADGGDFVATASYVVRPRAPMRWLDPGVFGTLGVGAGFSLGAKLARPDSEVWVLFGDGAFGYGPAEYDTFARHEVPVIGVVGNDAGWTQIAREQVELLHDDVGTVLAATDYERAAEGLGACGLRLVPGDDLDGRLEQALALARQGRPVYVNARIGRTAFRKGSISM